MKSWKMKLALGALATTFVAVPVFDTVLWTGVVAAGPDRDPPVVMVQAAEPTKVGETLTVGAQIVDPSGIGDVVLWVRGEREEEYRQFPMELVDEDHVQARIQPWPEQGSHVAYYIEARDAKGNGPGYAGAPRTPYIIRLKGAAPAPAEAQTNWLLWTVTAGSLLVSVCGFFLYRRAARNRLHADLNVELSRLTGIEQETKAVAQAPAQSPVHSKPRVQVPQNPAEQAFWIGLLSPIRDMGWYDREHALNNMAVRAHNHPTLGKRFFDVGTLNRHFEWVRRGDIHVTAEMVADEPHPVANEEPEPPQA